MKATMDQLKQFCLLNVLMMGEEADDDTTNAVLNIFGPPTARDMEPAQQLHNVMVIRELREVVESSEQAP